MKYSNIAISVLSILLMACEPSQTPLPVYNPPIFDELIASVNETAEPMKWFIVTNRRDECFISKDGGPAGKIDEFTGGDKPMVKDFKNSMGLLYKVEVIRSNQNDTETVWTYYREKRVCEDEQVNANKILADQYR